MLTLILIGGGGQAPIPPPTPAEAGRGIGAIVFAEKCKLKRKSRQQILADRTTASLAAVGNLLIPSDLLCADRSKSPWLKKKKRLQVTGLMLGDFDIVDAEKELRR